MYLLIQLPKQQEIIKFSSYQMQHVQYLKCYQGSLWAILILHFICLKAYETGRQESWTEQLFSVQKAGPAGTCAIPNLYQKPPNSRLDLRKSTRRRNKSIEERRSWGSGTWTWLEIRIPPARLLHAHFLSVQTPRPQRVPAQNRGGEKGTGTSGGPGSSPWLTASVSAWTSRLWAT